MSRERLYRFADSTVVEPLIDRWYAWSFMLSPVPAGLHLLNYQIETMRSYLKNPDIHIKACRDPGLIGGPFMDIPAEKAGDIRRLLEETQERRRDQIELARAAIEFHNLLVDEAKGQSLEPYYDALPDVLGGYVELLYDYYNRPTMRLLEGLLYESKYYDKGLQSLRITTLEQDGTRPFFISTPRLAAADEINWDIPFDDARVDEFFGLDIEAQPLDRIRETLGLTGKDDRLLDQLLTEEPSFVPERWKEETIRIRYIGHASVLMEWNGISILTDPYIGVRPRAGGMARLSYRDLPEKIDYALVTHNHQDHCALETLLRLRNRIECLVFPKTFGLLYGDVSLKLMAQKIGFKRVVELDSLESIALPDGEIIAIPFMGEHGDLAHGKTGYVVRAGREQVLFGADSDCLDSRVYENLRRAIGPVETVFLGTESVGAPLSWICGPLFPKKIDRVMEQTRRYHGADAKAGIGIVEAVGAKRIYNYAMGMEPWLDHLLGLCLTENSPQIEESNKLLRKARGRGLLAAERLFGTRDIYIGRKSPAIPARTTQHGAGLSDEQTPSLVQERLLLLDDLAHRGGNLPLCASFTVSGDLNMEALEQSLNEVIRRHEILRSRFHGGGGKDGRLLLTDDRLSLRLVDCTALRGGQDRDISKMPAMEDAQKPIDLSGEVLLRASVVKLAREESILLLTAHQGVADHRSMELLTGEVTTLYNAFSSGVSSPLEELPLQFAGYVGNHCRNVRGGRLEQELYFWEQQMTGALAAPELPDERPRRETRSFREGREEFTLSEDLSQRLRELSKREDRPLYLLLLCAFQSLLHMCAQQEDILVGLVVDGRSRPGTEALIGPFAHLLPLRTDLSANPSFLGLMARASEVLARAFEDRHSPFELPAASMAIEAGAHRILPARVMFSFDQALSEPASRPRLRPVSARPVMRFYGLESNSDLWLSLLDEGRVLSGTIQYYSDIFAAETVALLADHLKGLLEAVAEDVNTRLSDIRLFAQARPAFAGSGPGGQNITDAQDQFIF